MSTTDVRGFRVVPHKAMLFFQHIEVGALQPLAFRPVFRTVPVPQHVVVDVLHVPVVRGNPVYVLVAVEPSFSAVFLLPRLRPPTSCLLRPAVLLPVAAAAAAAAPAAAVTSLCWPLECWIVMMVTLVEVARRATGTRSVHTNKPQHAEL